MSPTPATLPESVGYIAKVVQTLWDMDGVAKAGAVREAIVAAMVAAKEPINETLQSGAPKYQNDIRWARMYLVNAGMLEPTESSGRGTWKLTQEGWSTPLNEAAVLAIYFKSEGKNGAPPPDSTVALSDDGLQRDLPGLNSWESQLKKLLIKMPDKGFERLCAEIMTKNGLHSTRVTGSTGDQGIDGEGFFAIDSLRLISVKVAWQCKRFAKGKVAPEEIRDFRGAMAADTDHGIFFTTSFFTAGAVAEARHPGKTFIELVNLERVIELLRDLSLGIHDKGGAEGPQKLELDKQFYDPYMKPALSAYPLLMASLGVAKAPT